MHRDHNETNAAGGAHDGDCGGCELADRRRFLQQAAALVAGALVGLGMSADRAVAMPLNFITGTRSPNGKDVSFPIPAADGATVDRDNDMILARYQGKVYAFGLACPHQNTALRWLPAEGRFQCPKHKSKYAPDGTFLSDRATRSMDRYEVRLVGNSVAVDVDKLYQEDTDLAQWQHAVVTLP